MQEGLDDVFEYPIRKISNTVIYRAQYPVQPCPTSVAGAVSVVIGAAATIGDARGTPSFSTGVVEVRKCYINAGIHRTAVNLGSLRKSVINELVDPKIVVAISSAVASGSYDKRSARIGQDFKCILTLVTTLFIKQAISSIFRK